MLHVFIRNGDGEDLAGKLLFIRKGAHPFSKAAALHVLLHGHDQPVGGGKTAHHFFVHGLHKAGVHQRTGKAAFLQTLSDTFRSLHHASHRKKGDSLLFIDHLRFPVLHRSAELRQPVIGFPAGIADGDGRRKCCRKFHHVRQLPFILGRADMHVGDGGEIGQVEDSLMGLPVASHQPGPVNGKDHGQILDAHVMQNLVVSPLQEGGIDGDHRLQSARRKPCRECHRMLFRNPHIKKPVRIGVAEPFQARAIRHGRRDGHNLVISLPQLHHDGGENIRVVGLHFLFQRHARLHVKGLRPMKTGRMPFRRRISLPLFGEHMDENRVLSALRFPDHPHERRRIVSVHRSQIGHAHILEQHARNHQLLQAVLRPPDSGHNRIPVFGVADGVINAVLHIQIGVGGADIAQIFGNAAHIFRNGHVVVIQNDDEIGFQPCRVVQRLICHSSGQGAVSDHGNHRVVLPLQVPGLHQTESRRNGSGAVARIKAVAVAFLSLGEAAHAAVFSQRLKAVPPSGQKLVGIGLVPHIPDDLVLRQIQHQMERHGELHRAQIGTKVASGHTDLIHQKFPDFRRQRRIIPGTDFLNVVWLLYLIKKHFYPLSGA